MPRCVARELASSAVRWIEENKEWVFSGIGVAFLLAIWGLARRIFGGRRHLPDAAPAIPPPPMAEQFHELSGIQMEHFRADPVIRARVRELEQEGCEFAIPLRHQLPTKTAEGWDFLRTDDGRRCHYVSRFALHEEFFLMFRRPVVKK